MTETERLSILGDYALGKLGTRDTIERLGLRDYADLVIAIARNGVDFPQPVRNPILDAHRRAARDLLMPRLTREL